MTGPADFSAKNAPQTGAPETPKRSPQSTGTREITRTPKYKKLGPTRGKQTLAYQPQRQRRMIKVDRVDPRDLNHFEVRFFCDDCCHYDRERKWCSMGYIPQHTREEQMALYNLTGNMAFCRFLEID